MKDVELKELIEQFAKDVANSEVSKRLMMFTSDWPEEYDDTRKKQTTDGMLAPVNHFITILESKYNLVKK